MSLEKFASRGLKAQAGIDRFIADHKKILPAADDAGSAEPKTGAGQTNNTAPRSGGSRRDAGAPGDMVSRIGVAVDVPWLKAVMGSQDYQVAVRAAAQRRLGRLFKKKKSK